MINSKKLYIALFFFFALFSFGCIKQLDLEEIDFDKAYFVHAVFSDTLETQVIEVLENNDLGSQLKIGVNATSVKVIDDLGDEINFVNEGNGRYTAFAEAKENREYKLDITIEDGSRIQSDFQSVPPSVKLDSLSFIEGEVSFISSSGFTRTNNVVDVFAHTTLNNNSPEFIRLGNFEAVYRLNERNNIPFPAPKDCYIYDREVEFEFSALRKSDTDSDQQLTAKILRRKTDHAFANVYGIRASIYGINEFSFDYWNSLEAVYQQNGQIIDPIPAQIGTNLTIDGERPIIGEFSVVSKSTVLKFIRRSDLEQRVVPLCGEVGNVLPFPLPQPCRNCLSVPGATTERPNYW